MDIESLRTYCLTLPGATEAIRWEHHLNFYIGGKMFCISTLDADGRVSFRVPDEDYDEMSSRPYTVPSAYLARSKWVMVGAFDDLSDQEWQFYLRQSYGIIRSRLPKKVQAGLPVWEG